MSSSFSKGYLWLSGLVLGYIGIYLCRKNFAVAVPLLQEHFHATRAEVGVIASYSTIAYAAGKFLFGSLVDRVGGRAGFFGALIFVALMGLAGGFAPSLAVLTVFYSLNRFAGAAGWPAMVKMTPDWFEKRQLPFALALLSLSFVIGGALSTMLAGQIAKWSGNNWRYVMAGPSLILLIFIVANWLILPRDRASVAMDSPGIKPSAWSNFRILFASPQFWMICGMSFILTLLRETFNTWTVDFIKTEGGAAVSHQVAAFLSTPYDLMGVLGILAVGWTYGRLSAGGRKWMLTAMLLALAFLLLNLPNLFKLGLAAVTIALGLIGFLIYGPYSLLAGTLSVEVRGPKYAGSVSGLVDGFGYFAGVLAGAQFGRIVDQGGYALGFKALAALAFASAVLCFFLYLSLGRGPADERV